MSDAKGLMSGHNNTAWKPSGIKPSIRAPGSATWGLSDPTPVLMGYERQTIDYAWFLCTLEDCEAHTWTSGL